MSDNGTVDRVFGADRPKAFEVLGEVFHLRAVRPEAWADSLRRAEEAETGADTKLDDLFGIRDERILLSIVPDEHDRWRELRARDDEPLQLRDLNEIMSWLTEVHTGRPTLSAEASSAGPGSSGASSRAGSSSQVVRPRR